MLSDFDNTESYGNYSPIVVTCLVCKSIELSLVKKKYIILGEVIFKVLLSQENEKISVQLIRRAVSFFILFYCSRWSFLSKTKEGCAR